MSDELMNAASRGPGRPAKHIAAVPVTKEGVILDQEIKDEPNHGGAAPPDTSFEMAQLKEDNANLLKLVMEMRAKLMPETVKAEDRPPILDKKRPYAKTRSMDTGITYEQDGKTYNGKFELIEG